jgi:hypothetical protein
MGRRLSATIQSPEGVLPGHHPYCRCGACAEVIARFEEGALLQTRKLHSEPMARKGYTELEKNIFWACMETGLWPPGCTPRGNIKDFTMPPKFGKQQRGYIDKNGYTEEEKRICLMCIEAGIRPPNVPSCAVNCWILGHPKK